MSTILSVNNMPHLVSWNILDSKFSCWNPILFTFLTLFLLYHLEFFTDFISFNQAPCSRSKNQYKLGACQKMQNYIFFSNQNIYLYISISELSCIFFHVKKHLTSTKDACEKWWIVQFTISRVNNVPDIGGKPSK